MELMEHQLDAVEQLGNGKVLWGGVGSGKSATVLAYYTKVNEFEKMPLYVITTAKKRDSLDWEKEAANFGITTPILTVDSWNNLGKYINIEGAFFVFDEQRVTGHGAWVRSFLKIAPKNHWVLLSATPGDTWLDYAPVFIANGYYRNITDFKQKHVLYEPFSKYPKVRAYIGVGRLELLRNEVLVEMPYLQRSRRQINWLEVGHDKELFHTVYKKRWNSFEDRPIIDAAEMFRLMRRIVNQDPSRLEMIRFLMKSHPRIIVFYNFDYELAILRTLNDEIEVAELNGHRHDPVPTSKRWIYLVQYIAGAEAWNCTTTNAMVLYSLTYSYKNHIQALGRIDRMNSNYDTLYYYVLVSNSAIDRSVRKSLLKKQNFNEKNFMLDLDDFEPAEDDYLDACQKCE